MMRLAYLQKPMGLNQRRLRRIENKQTDIKDEISLRALKQISSEDAKYLIKCNYNAVYLYSLPEITPEIAKHFSEFLGTTMVLGLETLDPETATQLSSFQGEELILSNLKSPSPEVLKILEDMNYYTVKITLPKKDQPQ